MQLYKQYPCLRTSLKKKVIRVAGNITKKKSKESYTNIYMFCVSYSGYPTIFRRKKNYQISKTIVCFLYVISYYFNESKLSLYRMKILSHAAI